MGDTIWVDVEGRPNGELPSDHSLMLRLKDDLDALCRELGVMPLSSFYDYSELVANYAPEYAGTAGSDNFQSPESWFDPAPALRAVQVISGFLSQNPEKLDFSDDPGKRHWRTALSKQLRDCEGTLEDACSKGRKFRFLIVP